MEVGYILCEFYFIARGHFKMLIIKMDDDKPKTSPAQKNFSLGPIPAWAGPGTRWQFWGLVGGAHCCFRSPPPQTLGPPLLCVSVCVCDSPVWTFWSTCPKVSLADCTPKCQECVCTRQSGPCEDTHLSPWNTCFCMYL